MPSTGPREREDRTKVADTGLTDAIERLQALIESDGGSFELLAFDSSKATLRLRLNLDRVTCAECILPPDALRQVAADFLRRALPYVAVVEVDDPREGPPGR
jgi:Fe-S cluster biogenesis protein NfuA